MSGLYFCVFCDTMVLSSAEMAEHVGQHLGRKGGHYDDYDSDDPSAVRELTDVEKRVVDRLMAYEEQLNVTLQLIPQELPEDSVQTLLMGCPVCDSLIRCHELDFSNKSYVGRDSTQGIPEPTVAAAVDGSPLSPIGGHNSYSHLPSGDRNS
ncbi:unnamed protein product, partial [Medioppia subpectinata]